MSKQSIEKKYFQLITSGHYVDVMNTQSQWQMAKVIQKDKRYIWVTYDGLLQKQQQLFTTSYRVAPLRLHTQGFTGSYSKIYRNNIPKIADYKNYLQFVREKSLNQQKAKSFQITQLIRGQLFVYVHDLLCRQTLFTPTQIIEINSFLEIFVDFVNSVIQKALAYKEEYFSASFATNKLLYLINPKIALVQSLQQLLILMELILKADGYRLSNLWKVIFSTKKQYNKTVISQQKLSEIFQKKKGLENLYEIFISNDKNGRWYPSSVRKSIYKILIKNVLTKPNFIMPPLPKYEVRDFQEFYSIYPFMVKCSPELASQNQFVDFSIKILLTNSSFDAKLKSIQQLKRGLEGKNMFQFLQKGKILAKIEQSGVVQQLLQNKNFNPQVFKRFVPIISLLSKTKTSLSMKQIHSLFQIVKYRHESQTEMIFDIISDICEFAPSSLLDNVYAEICKIDVNSIQTIKFIKTFTMKAVENLSKEKSMWSGFFGKKKGSSKYGYYGLNLLYKQSQDQGRITRQMLLFTLNIIKQLLVEKPFLQERWQYISSCVDFIKKRKNFGQSIKLICLILSTFNEATFWNQDRKKAVQKLDGKYNVIQNIIEGFKNIQSIPQTKVFHKECFQYFYELIDTLSVYIKVPLKTSHIEFLWYKSDPEPLLNYLRRSRPDQKHQKIIMPQIIQQIFSSILKKGSFYNRKMSLFQFQTIYELFLSYHSAKENIQLKANGFVIRYNKINLLGLDYFITYLQKSQDEQSFQKAAKIFIQIFLRPKMPQNLPLQVYLQQKVSTWKQMFKKCVQKLISRPIRCLSFIQIFYTSIEGKLYKQITRSDTSNAEILVQCSQQQKIVSIQRFSTIYRLRKVIKQKFRLNQDFTIYNIKINKTISFQEEQQFSVNAMPFYENGKEVTLRLQLKNNKLHQQQMAILLFNESIEKEEKLYEMLFAIVESNDLSIETQKTFWKVIELLPLNKAMMHEIEKCQYFNLQKWTAYFSTVSQSSLQYKLSIILNLIKKSSKWVLKMQQTYGLLAVILLLIKTIQSHDFTIQNETLISKIIQVIEKVYEKCPQKEIQTEILKQANETVIKVIQKEFQQKTPNMIEDHLKIKEKENQNSHIFSLQLLNRFLSFYLSNLKFLQGKIQPNNLNSDSPNINVSTFIRILDQGLFAKKTQSSQKFAQQVAISLYYALYDNLETKNFILSYLIKQLTLQKLLTKERTDNYFKFLITVLYSLQEEKPQNQQNNQPKVIQNFRLQIWNFFNFVVDSKQIKNDEQKSHQQIIYGAFSLLKFLLFKINEKFNQDPKEIFQRLINNFLLPLNHCGKKLKSQKNKKILFEIIKKLSFQTPSVLDSLFEKLAPFLQKNKLRKNTMISWNLHFQNSEKKHFVGLQNLGATCYINCLFQQLFMISKFRENFIPIDSRSYKKQLQKNEIYQLQKLFYSLKFGDRKSETTKNFCSSFITFQGEPINPVVQSDADQFFNTLMDRIQTFLKQTNHNDILEETFQGKLSNQLNCEGCPHRSEKIEPFMSIGVNLKNKKTLEEALKGYVQGQILDGDNAYYCELCDKKVRTLKRLCIKQLPNILVIVLKRFEYDFDTYKKLKINSYLEFPQKLNMTEYTSEYLESKSMQKLQGTASSEQKIKVNQNKNIFHLRGSVIHAGYAQAGHYYSFIKDNQEWFEFNDQFIRKINYAKVQQQGFGGDQKDSDQMKIQKYKNAYILFYERENVSSDKIQNSHFSQNQSSLMGVKENQKILEPQLEMKKLQSIKEFSDQMSQSILAENMDANIFATLLEPNFIHYIENLSILENESVGKFIFLYFHTVILRDRMRYEFATNYFRILSKYLVPQALMKNQKKEQTQAQVEQKSKSKISQWFLSQVNKSYVRQFLIQAPKSVRMICVSLILTAINYAQKIPENLPLILVSSIRRTGMSPFGLIFKALLKRKQTRQQLIDLKYFEIIRDMLFSSDKTQKIDLPIIVNETESYFGSDCSQMQAEKEKCSVALLDSLQTYQGLTIEMILKANESYSFRSSNRVLLKRLCQIVSQDILKGSRQVDFIIGLIKSFQEKIASSNCAKQFVQKYLFFIRYLVLTFADYNLSQKINQIVTDSLQSFIMTSFKNYEPMDWIMRELTKIALKNQSFKSIWQKIISKNINLKLQIQNWLKQVERLQCINTKDDFFSNIRQMQNKEKAKFLKKYGKKMRQKTSWMFSPEQDNQLEAEESDLEAVKENNIVSVRNRSFMIKQKFGSGMLYLASYIQKEDQTVWIYLQKAQIETLNNL